MSHGKVVLIVRSSCCFLILFLLFFFHWPSHNSSSPFAYCKKLDARHFYFRTLRCLVLLFFLWCFFLLLFLLWQKFREYLFDRFFYRVLQFAFLDVLMLLCAWNFLFVFWRIRRLVLLFRVPG